MQPMPLALSIKNVPEEIAQRLKQRASRNHRSLQGELLAILESVMEPAPASRIDEIHAKVQASGVKTPRGETARMIRRERDDRAIG
jgi:plasmid stability protein